ncbi:hypothetical protein [Candidatus Agathobaculum pullicola]|uniref:hypothetical protein n=1 Tax=Candidatus Agathobaculum pullicola TaxID=2838426 RepID=UPI003F901752
MTSKSFSSKGLLGDSLRQNLWGFVLGGVGFFFSLLLPVLMTMQRALENRAEQLQRFPEFVDQDWQRALSTVTTLLSGGNPFVKAAFVVMAIVCGIAMFAYLHARQKVDFYHSLPISRTRLFVNNYLTGVIFAVSTYAVMLIITIVCTFAMGFGAAVDWAAIGGTVLCYLIVFLLLYALTVLTTVVCGNTVITLLLLAWVMLSPMLVRMLYSSLCDKFYQSFTMESANVQEIFHLSPLVQFFMLDGLYYGRMSSVNMNYAERTSALGLLLLYLVAAVAITVLGWYLFRIRRSERTGVALAFTPAKLPIKVYMCLIMGVAFGLVFGMIAGDFWFWVGLVLGTVLFHWIVEMIYAFDFHAIFAKPVHLAAILVVLFAGMLCMKFDVTGYDSWLPNRDSIQAVSIDGSAQEELTNLDNIDAVYQLAEMGTQINRDALQKEGNYRGLTLRFRLGSRTAMRFFLLPDDEEVNTLCNQIYSSEEYKRATWPLFQVDLEQQNAQSQYSLDIYTTESGYEVASTLNFRDYTRQILAALQKESLARTENGLPVLRLEIFRLDENGVELWEGDAYVAAEDKETLALIEKLTGIKPMPLSTDNVTQIELQYSMQEANGDTVLQSVEVTDPADIAVLLKNGINRDAMNLYGANEAAMNGFFFDKRIDSVHVVAYVNHGEVENWYGLAYAEGDWPEEVVEKYRPDGFDTTNDDETSNGMATEEAG